MATTIVYGALAVWTQKRLFNNGYYKTILRNGVVIATAEFDANGKRVRFVRQK